MPVLAIDAGTTGITALVVGEDGGVVSRGYREFAQLFPRPGWVEHEPDDIWTATVAAARQALAEFRAATAPARHDAVMAELVARLAAASAEFAAWWPAHDVARFETRLRRFDHPRAGRLTFEYQQLTPAEWPDLRVVVHLPVPGDDSARRLSVRHHVV